MSGLGNSRWASKSVSRSFGEELKTPEEPEKIAVSSFGFKMPAFTKKPAPVARSPIVSSPEEAKSVETKQPAVNVAAPSQDPVKNETAKPVNKVNAVIQATRDQMARIIGRRQDRPSTADQTIGRGPTASYGGYVKRG